MTRQEAFEKWWHGSKYMQVVISSEASKQVARDAWQASRNAYRDEIKATGGIKVCVLSDLQSGTKDETLYRLLEGEV